MLTTLAFTKILKLKKGQLFETGLLCLIWNKILLFIFKYKIANLDFDYHKIKSIKLAKHSLNKIGLLDFYHAGISVLQDDKLEHVFYSGLDSNPLIAEDKAISEFLESESIKKMNLKEINNRNGMAVHVSNDLSIKKAYEELIERDSFLMHFLCPRLENKIIKEYSDKQTKWYFFKLQSIDPSIDVVLSVKKNIETNECYLGLAAKKDCSNIQELIQGAAQESTMLESIWLVPNFYLGSKERKKEFLLLNHLRAINSDSTNNWLQTLIDSNDKNDPKLKLIQIYDFSSLKIKIISSETPKRSFSYLQSHLLLPLYFGDKWEDEKDNYKKILSMRNLEIENWAIHPLL